MNERTQLYHNTKYVFWSKDAYKKNLKHEDFTELYNGLDKSKYVLSKLKTKKIDWLKIGNGAWRYEQKGDYENIYLFNEHKWYIYSTNKIDDNKNLEQEAGPNMHLSNGKGGYANSGIKILRAKFSERTGLTFKTAFGTTNEEYKNFIPKQFYYNILGDSINKYSSSKKKDRANFSNVSSIDYSSMYPSGGCGKLPDAHTATEVEGKVEPNEEYPFAFYPCTGHMAIYGELDTHNWLKSYMSDYVFRPEQDPYTFDTKTILMKSSQYELTPEFEWGYEVKSTYNEDTEEYKQAKLILNSSIGCMHRKEYNRDKYAHIAAVIIARSNEKMLNKIKLLEKKDIIQVCVDGLLYKGSYKLGSDTKGLGVAVQEFIGCNISYKGQNMYIVEKDGKIVKCKHGACNYFDDGRLIEGNVNSLDDIDHWVRIENSSTTRKREVSELTGGINE